MFISFRAEKRDASMAAEKKRNRDRRAQQNRRERQNNKIAELERQIAFYQGQHPNHTFKGCETLDTLRERIRYLEDANNALQVRVEKMTGLANSAQQILSQMMVLPYGEIGTNCSDASQEANLDDSLRTADQRQSLTHHPQPVDSLYTPSEQPPLVEEQASQTVDSGCQRIGIGNTVTRLADYDLDCSPSSPGLSSIPDDEGSADTPCITQQPQILSVNRSTEEPKERNHDASHQMKIFDVGHHETNEHIEDTLFHSYLPICPHGCPIGFPYSLKFNSAPWALIPNSSLDHPWVDWFSDPDNILKSPSIPNPIDILFGSKTNYLANKIHRAVRRGRVAEPERLAYGWLLYLYSKWRINPTKESYDLVPEFLKPIPEQITINHPPIFDMILWPVIRCNLLHKIGDREDRTFVGLEEIFDTFSCCAKIRWPWGKEIIEPSGQDGIFQVRTEFLDTFTKLEGWGLTSHFISTYGDLLDGFDSERSMYYLDVLSDLDSK